MRTSGLCFAVVLTALTISASSLSAQVPTPEPTPVPSPEKPSIVLARNLETYDATAGIPRERREQAYVRLLEAQRSIWRISYQRTQAARTGLIAQAREALLRSLELDPGLSEGYVALAELALMSSSGDIDEAVALCAMATRVNKDSLGGHRWLARLLTKTSGLRDSRLNYDVAVRAISEWKEVARLDPRSSEAWAFLSEFYERSNRTNEAIDALRKWSGSTTSIDTLWYRQLLGGRPEDLLPENAALRLGAALVKGGRIQEAIELLSQILADDPDNTDAKDQVQSAVESADPATAAKSMGFLRQVVAANPGNLSLLGFFAGLDAKVGNLEEAIRTLDKAVLRIQAKERPAAANLQITIGDIYAQHGRPLEAAAAYEKGLATRGLDSASTLDPEERDFVMTVFDKLITVYKRANKIDEAKAAIIRARKMLGNDDLFADRLLISLYRDTGRRTEALSVVRDVRTRNAEDVTMLRLEATLLMETGNVDGAVSLIRDRISSGRKPASTDRTLPRLDDDFSNLIFIAQLYSDAGRGEEAIRSAQEALAAAGSENRRDLARLMLAAANNNAGKFAEAETLLREILSRSPGNPIALNNLGYYLVERGERLAEAIGLIEQALQIDGKNPSYLDSLGWAYFKSGRLNDAARKLESAAMLDDSSGTILEHLGEVYLSLGNFDKARTAWERAARLLSSPAEVARVNQKLEKLKIAGK